jgi:hypothetical protein
MEEKGSCELRVTSYLGYLDLLGCLGSLSYELRVS